MDTRPPAQVYLSYAEDNQEAVETLARRLQGDARLSFWFGPWHSVPGLPIQEQMEEALLQAQSCAVFISGGASQIAGWQNEQMRAGIQTRVEDDASYRIIPVLLPGTTRPSRRDMPPFLRRYEPVEFRNLDDEQAFQRLLAGILGVPPVLVGSHINAEVAKEQLPLPPAGTFAHGHALLIGVANYPNLNPLGETVLNDVHDLHALLIDPATCGYPAANVSRLLDAEATGAGIRAALAALAARVTEDDTAIVFFSGHGAHDPGHGASRQYVVPYDGDALALQDTAIAGDEMTALLRSVKAGRLLVFFDSCHSGGAAEPRGLATKIHRGLSEDYYAALAQGSGRVVIASSRPDEVSWQLDEMRNGLFTHYLLEALRGEGRTLGDGYVRVFDVFRHVADHVREQADQHPIFKATAMEEDFPIALVARPKI